MSIKSVPYAGHARDNLTLGSSSQDVRACYSLGTSSDASYVLACLMGSDSTLILSLHAIGTKLNGCFPGPEPSQPTVTLEESTRISGWDFSNPQHHSIVRIRFLVEEI